jgi:hypothetical protein
MRRIRHGLIALALSGAFALVAGVLVADRGSGATPTADDGWIVAGGAVADEGIIYPGLADGDRPIIVQGGG